MNINRIGRGFYIEPFQFAANWIVRINAPQNHIGICDRWSIIAQPISDRTGVRACALRSDIQQTALINPRNRAATSADCRDLDHRCAHNHTKINRGLRG